MPLNDCVFGVLLQRLREIVLVVLCRVIGSDDGRPPFLDRPDVRLGCSSVDCVAESSRSLRSPRFWRRCRPAEAQGAYLAASRVDSHRARTTGVRTGADFVGLEDEIASAQRANRDMEAAEQWWKAVGGSPRDPVVRRAEGEWADLLREVLPLVTWEENKRGHKNLDTAPRIKGARSVLYVTSVRVFKGPDGTHRLDDLFKSDGPVKQMYPGERALAVYGMWRVLGDSDTHLGVYLFQDGYRICPLGWDYVATPANVRTRLVNHLAEYPDALSPSASKRRMGSWLKRLKGR